MGTKDSRRPGEDVLNSVRQVQESTAEATAEFFGQGGVWGNSPTASGTALLWKAERVSKFGYRVPSFTPVLLDSFTTATGSGTGTYLTGLEAFRDLQVYVDVTFGTGTTPTLDLYLDSRLDATNNVNIAHIAFTGTGKSVVTFTRRQAAGSVAVGTDAGAGTVRAIAPGDDVQVRRAISGTTPQFSATVWIMGIG